MKNNNAYVNREELAYLESYIFSAKKSREDFGLALMFSNQDEINKFEKTAEEYLSSKNDAVLIQEGLAIYQEILGGEVGPAFVKALRDKTNENIKRLQADQERMSQILNDPDFSKGQLLLNGLHEASEGRLPMLTKKLNDQQFSVLLWLVVADMNYSKKLSRVYGWLNSTNPDVKKRERYIALAEEMNKAIQSDNISAIKKLLSQGVDIAQVNYPLEVFPLEVAAINASVETLNFILEVTPTMEVATLDGWIKSISLAIENNKRDKVGILVNALSASTWAVEEFWPPLMEHAWNTGDPTFMRLLVDFMPAKFPNETLYEIIDTFLTYPYNTHLIETHQKVLARLLSKAPDYNNTKGKGEWPARQVGGPAMSALLNKNYLLLDLLLSHQNGIFQSESEFITTKARLVQAAAYNEDLRALKLFHKHGANFIEYEYGSESLSILGGRIIYTNMELTVNKQKVIDYLVSLNIPLVLTDDQNQLGYLIRSYAKHRGISEAEAVSFFKCKAITDN